MPTTAEHPLQRPGLLQSPSLSWTDALPVCRDSAVGTYSNQIYKNDGTVYTDHEFQDQSFHFRPSSDVCLYAVFDGHDSNLASNFAVQRLPAEILFDQLLGKKNDNEIKEVLRQSLVAVERGFFESIDDKLAEIANLKMEFPDGMNAYDVSQQYPDFVNKLRHLNQEIAGGTTAVVALIYQHKLFVANVGDSRALLVKKDPSTNKLDVMQLSIDHDVRNEDELLRLAHLGIDVEQLRQTGTLGNQSYTRCIGNYQVKGNYKDFEMLNQAVSEPVTAEPEISSGIPIDSSCMFLLLMSKGLIKTLESISQTSDVNVDIANLVLEQCSLQTNMPAVVQSTVHKVVQMHHDKFMNICTGNALYNVPTSSGPLHFRDDITLLVRNFNTPLNAMNTDRWMIPDEDVTSETSLQDESMNSERESSDLTNTNTSTQEDSPPEVFISPNPSSEISVDDDGRTEAYVDFSEYYEAVAAAEKQGIDVFLNVDLVEGWRNTNEISVIAEEK